MWALLYLVFLSRCHFILSFENSKEASFHSEPSLFLILLLAFQFQPSTKVALFLFIED
jgi:hypothetical protein